LCFPFFLAHTLWAQNPLKEIEQQQQQLFEKVAPSVVFVSNGHGFGSGFFINDEGLILTNQHVIGNSKKLTVVLHDGRKVAASFVEKASDNVDLALIKVDLGKVTPLDIYSRKLIKVGSWVGSIGHGEGGIWTFNTGMISNIYPNGNSRPVFQTQIPLNPGNSGGPIFNRDGDVVGIVTSGLIDSNNINFGIRIDHAVRYLEAIAKNGSNLTIKAPAGVPIFVNGQMAGKGPKIVIDAKNSDYIVFAVIKGKMKKVEFTYPNKKIIELK